MKIGIEAAAYFRRFGVEKGSYLAREHGYDCVDFGDLSETETEFFRLPEAEFEKRLVYIKDEMAKNVKAASMEQLPLDGLRRVRYNGLAVPPAVSNNAQ